MTILVTGGAGFIGSALIRYLVLVQDQTVVNVDNLTYAGNLETLDEVIADGRYAFEKVDIADATAMRRIFACYRPQAVINLAAESHVDRSIDGPGAFIQTNVNGTFVLLEAARNHYDSLRGEAKDRFRFLHVSTDEVYGSLGACGLFNEANAYAPNLPYAASKAASDHLVRAWFATYRLPTIVTNCSNNYGPFQFPEKLIPLMALKALEGEPLPMYGSGGQIRDWIHVEDHVRALVRVIEAGTPGETYLIGARNERTNLSLIQEICRLVDGLVDHETRCAELIRHVEDRPGHDVRYAIDNAKIVRELNWRPIVRFDSGLEATIQWIIEHQDYYDRIRACSYAGERLGTAAAR